MLSLFNINHSPRTPYSPWTRKVQNRNLGLHLRLIVQNPPTNQSFQTEMYAYAHNTTPLSQLKPSPDQIVFHTYPRIPLTFFINLIHDSSKTCMAIYCKSLPHHTHYKIKISTLFPLTPQQTYFLIGFNITIQMPQRTSKTLMWNS